MGEEGKAEGECICCIRKWCSMMRIEVLGLLDFAR